MTEEESQAAANGEAVGEAGEKPTKKKTSVKVVRRVKSKKSEKGERPELAPPPATIDEQQPAGGETAEAGAASTRQQLDVAEPKAPTSTNSSSRSAALAAAAAAESKPVERRHSSKRRAQRTGSNVFAMFTQNQIQQFKEAFGFIDQDKDGIISKSDIRATFDALGRLCSDKELAEMVSEAPGPINFTMFLSVFGDRIQGTDDEEVVQDAFSRFDEGDGFCREEK